MKKVVTFFAFMAMLIYAGLYQARAQEQQPTTEFKTILAGTIWLDNKCIGETCTTMKFEFNLTSDKMVNLIFYNYCTKETYPEGTQMPLELAKELQKILQRLYPKTVMESDGKNAIFPLFEQKKNINLLDQGISIMDNIGKAKTKFKIVTEHYASE